MTEKQREGFLVKNPTERLSINQIKLIDSTSRQILENPGVFCYNSEAAELYKKAGAKIRQLTDCVQIKIPSELIDKILETAPSKIVLGARNPDNRLVLDADEPRVRFVSGAETNFWLDVNFENNAPVFTRKDGSIDLLGRAAHLAENLDNLDSFIRCVNIRDKEITSENKDVNKFFASLNNITKHVQAGLTDLTALDDVLKIGEMIAGGKKDLEQNPVLSFIACVVKSPLQVVDDTAAKLIEIAKRKMPIVVSSSPMGGVTAPYDEFGMIAQINAELLAGVALHQLAAPGAPVLYGSVPVSTRLDNLNDMYGSPNFNHYNHCCVQMARFYHLPSYSTAGVGDTETPGIQATAEKMITLMSVPWSGAQYIHYAFGLLERTNLFSPEQAIMDNAHIGIVKDALKSADFAAEQQKKVLETVREVMSTEHRSYIYHLPLPTREPVYVSYPLEDEDGDALFAAHNKYNKIMQMQRKHLPEKLQKEIAAHIPNILAKTLN
jgi:trimethylamine---corrinoid protein Co-methyltransferase